MPYKTEKGRIDLTPELKATLRIPDEWRAVVAAVLREGLQVPRGIGELKDTRGRSQSRSCPSIGDQGAELRVYSSGASTGSCRIVKNVQVNPAATFCLAQ